jgi:hypothetical protein
MRTDRHHYSKCIHVMHFVPTIYDSYVKMLIHTHTHTHIYIYIYIRAMRSSRLQINTSQLINKLVILFRVYHISWQVCNLKRSCSCHVRNCKHNNGWYRLCRLVESSPPKHFILATISNVICIHRFRAVVRLLFLILQIKKKENLNNIFEAPLSGNSGTYNKWP